MRPRRSGRSPVLRPTGTCCRWLAVGILTLWAVLAPSPASAFKFETHVWIAQQVLNDLQTCQIEGQPGQPCVTVTFTDPVTHQVVRTVKLKVDPGVFASLTQHPGAFRMGAIGPDGFPDLVGGQLTAHPGISGRWQTDTWLSSILWKARKPTPPTWFRSWIGSDEHAFAHGYVTHAAADIFAHSYVNTYAGDVFLLTDGEQEAEARHMLLETFIRDHTPRLADAQGVFIGEPYNVLSTPTMFLRKSLILNAAAADEYRRSAATWHLAAMYDFWKKETDLINGIDSAVAEINTKISELQAQIDNLKKKRVCTPRVCVFGHCTPRACFNIWPAYCVLDLGTCVAVELTEVLLDQLRDAVALAGSQARQPIVDSRAQVERAVDEYIRTSEAIAKEMMKPDGHPTDKLTDWVACWTPAFAGVGELVSQTSCAPVKLLMDGYRGVQSVCDKVRALGLFAWAVAPMCPVQDLIEQQVQNGAATAVAGIADNATLTTIVRFGTEEASPSAVDAQFATDGTSKHLLKFDQGAPVSARASADMHLRADRTFDPEAFNAVHNAVQLAKLTLVGPAELNRMVTDESITNTIYGPELYEARTPFSILFGTVRSIDGNQQWQEAAFPYPREAPYPPQVNLSANYPYGYGFASGLSGFRLWQDCEVREKVFLYLFKGPLVDIDDLLQPGDPNLTVPGDPFPLAPGSVLPTKIDGIYHVCGQQTVPPMPPRPGSGGALGPDAAPPLLTPPDDVVAECVAGVAIDVELGEPTVYDARDPAPTVSNDAPATFAYGDTIVTWRATDASGNVAQGQQKVTVADTTPPAFDSVPGPVTFTATSPEGTTVTLAPPSATDSCGGEVTVGLADALEPLTIGTHTVTWRAVDRAGNAAAITQQVTIRRLRGDVDVDGDVDNADLDVVLANRGPAGSTPRDYDEDGDVDALDQAVFTMIDINLSGTVDLADGRDLLPLCTPVQCHPAVLCPDDIGRPNDPGEPGAVITFTPIVIALDPALGASAGPASGTLFPIGTTTVVASATDAAGTGTCSFAVTVVDTEPPHLAAPAGVVAEATSPAGAVVADVALGAYVASDNSGSVSVDRTGVPAGNLFPLGQTVVTYTARDPSGNLTVATQVVTVRDTTPPAITIVVPAATDYTLNQLVTASYSCSDAVSPVARCAGPVPSGSPIDTASPGAKTFTVSAADSLGNSTSQAVVYHVGYAVCLLYDPAKAARAGSTIPIKLQLCDAAGTNSSSPAVVVNATGVRLIGAATAGEVADAGNANPDSNFRYDAAIGGTGGYIFNLKTTGLASGTYGLALTAAGDPTPHEVTFVVR